MAQKVYGLFFRDRLLKASAKKRDLLRFRDLFVEQTRKRMVISCRGLSRRRLSTGGISRAGGQAWKDCRQ